MSINITNSLTNKKEEFVPKEKNKIGMYVCGPTVYDVAHIGHARAAFIFDIIRLYFEYKGYNVKYVRNITDIDDKIIDKAKESNAKGKTLNEKVKNIAEKYLQLYNYDMDLLGIGRAVIEPKATDHITEMIDIIKGLIDKGYAYELEGDVFFSVRQFKDYGKLSNRTIDSMIAGSRVSVDEKKRYALDFVLWKASKEDEPYWESPWGKGRPGWHIECSAMSIKYLGEDFDIHGGGRDLIFPHHENEIAQSVAYSGKNFSRYWIHNGLLTVNAEKMAKSTGNFITIKEITDKYHPEILKMLFLSTHYSKPLDFTYPKMNEIKKARERFYILFRKINDLTSSLNFPLKTGENGDCIDINELSAKFENNMDDDFNTAGALAVLFDLLNFANKSLDDNNTEKAYYACNKIIELGRIFRLFNNPYITNIDDRDIDINWIEDKIEVRKQYRKNKEFDKADAIREELLKKGIVIEDAKEKTIWRKV